MAFSWSTNGVMPQRRFRAATGVMSDGRVLVAMGETNIGATTATIIYDPAARTWSAAANSARSHSGQGPNMVRFPNDPLVTASLRNRMMVGPFVDGPPSSSRTMEIYDPTGNSWSDAVPTSRQYYNGYLFYVVVGGVAKILLFGEEFSASGSTKTELYDINANTIVAGPSLPGTLKERRFKAIQLANGKVLVTGGVTGGTTFDTAAVYDPSTNSWTATANNMSVARGDHAMSLLLDGKVLVVGGTNSSGDTNSADIYDPVTNMFTAATSARFKRSWANPTDYPVCYTMADGTVMVSVGGTTDTVDGIGNPNCEIFTPGGAGSWALGPTPGYSIFSEMMSVYLPAQNQILRAGGNQQGFGVTDTNEIFYEPITNVNITGSSFGSASATATLQSIDTPETESEEPPLPPSYPTLRRFFNGAIDGENVNGLLFAISTGDDFLNNLAKNLVSNLFVNTAVGDYLNTLGGNVGLIRPSGIGISDTAYRRIVSETINDQNIMKSILNVLDIYFTIFQNRAYAETESLESFALSAGDDLIIEIDGNTTFKIFFENNDFTAIGSATALEVANAISSKIKNLNGNAYAVPYYDVSGAPRKVRLVSDTLGPRSVVRILGGKANNVLKFHTFIHTTQDNTTRFTVATPTTLGGTTTRFTWNSGTNPSLSLLMEGDYVNIYGTGFNVNNRGTYIITRVVNGPANQMLFEVSNANSVAQSVTLSNASDMMFFRPTKRIVGSDLQYANAFELPNNEVKVFMPASTAVVARTPLTGGAYLADRFVVLNHSATTFTAGETVTGLTSKSSGVALTISSGITTLSNVQGTFVTSETIVGEQSGVTSTISSITSFIDNTVLGNYLINTNDFIITSKGTTLNTQLLKNGQYNVISVVSTVGFDPANGQIMLDMGFDNEEKPIPYEAILNSTDILLDTSYVFKNTHNVGASITLLNGKNKITPRGDGSDRGSYLTDIARARQSAVDLVNRIKSSGILYDIEILYPGDTGLGNAGLANSDKFRIWGTDE